MSLPEEPFDGMIFIDALRIKWIYDSSVKCWRHSGKVETIPVADNRTTGLLPKELKYMLDKIPPKGGGFAIITKPLNRLRDVNNPDGVLFGDIELFSDSLDIKCVNSKGDIIDPTTCRFANFCETDELPPGFDINISEKFLNSFCVEVPGGPGSMGDAGDQGVPGKDGTGDGPIGETGDSGLDAVTRRTLTGIKVVDLEDIYDTAVVKLELKQDEGKLFVTKGKVKLPVDVDTPAEQLIVQKLVKGIKFEGKCLDVFTIITTPCLPEEISLDQQQETQLVENEDPLVAFLPIHFNPESPIGRFQPVKGRLSDAIRQITDFYEQKLGEAAQKWDEEISKFIIEKDREARAVLDNAADELGAAEAANTVDMCVGINKDPQCADGGEEDPLNPTDSQDTEFAALMETLGCDPTTSQSAFVTKIRVFADIAPVFTFKAPDPFELPGKLRGGKDVTTLCDSPDGGCWLHYSEGAYSFVPNGAQIPPGTVSYDGGFTCGKRPPQVRTNIIPDDTDPAQITLVASLQSRIDSTSDLNEKALLQDQLDRLLAGYPRSRTIAGSFHDWAIKVADALRNNFVVHKKTRLRYSPNVVEFPSGLYIFQYDGGAFTQQRLNETERYKRPANDAMLVDGAFQKYFVGNEGNKHQRGEFFVLNPYKHARQEIFNSFLASEEIGLEIGFVPLGYQDLIPIDFFIKHEFKAINIQGFKQFDQPLPHVNYVGLSDEVKNMENTITWWNFPTANKNTNDPLSLENTYRNNLLSDKSVIIKVDQPGFFFVRVKLAYSAVNFFGSMIMPPVIGGDPDYSYNRALIYEAERFSPPIINARPVGIGHVDLKIFRVTGCGASGTETTEAIENSFD
jgi:hypothetical protein